MGQPSAPPAGERSRDSGTRLGLRVLLVAVGFVLVWVMEDRWQVAREAYAASFEWPMGSWLLLLGAGVLAGLAFGLACCLPARVGGYRWGRVLGVGIPSLALLVLGMVFLGDLGAVNDLPPGIRDVVFRLIGAGGPFLQPIAAVVLGMGFASGVAEPRPRPAGPSVATPPTGFDRAPPALTEPPPPAPPQPPGGGAGEAPPPTAPPPDSGRRSGGLR